MADAKDLFRKSAVEKLSSPEQLDVMMQVTSPMGWIALLGVGIILTFVTVWSVVGQIGIKVDGDGILIRGAAVLDVTSGAQGRLTELLAKAGDTVKSGQVIARLDQPELRLKIENMKAQLAQLQTQQREIGSRGSSIVAQYQAQQRELREKVATQEDLVRRGLLTRSTLLRTKEQLTSLEQLIAQSQMTTSGQEIKVDDLKRQLSELEGKFAGSVEIRSPYTGRVLEVMAAEGGIVAGGARLMTLEPLDAPLESVLYIPAAEGKKVRKGMNVRVSPSTVKAEEYGFMVGTVKSVSEFPVTPEGLRNVLRNDKLVETMMKASAPIEVVVTLIPDKDTPSGYKWSSSKGPPTQVYSGTLSKGSVVVDNKQPISYVLPVIKKTLGAG